MAKRDDDDSKPSNPEPDDDEGSSSDDAEPPEDEDEAPVPPIRPAVGAFLGRKDVFRWVFDHVARKVAESEARDVASSALLRASGKTVWPDSDEEKVLWATLDTVVDREIADHHKKRVRRRKYEGPMPVAAVALDEGGEPIEDEYSDDVDDVDPRHDPRADDERADGWLLKQFLQRAVKGKKRDEETLSWILEWAEGEDEEGRRKGYKQIAEANGLTESAVKSRVHEFRKKYLPRARKDRDRMVIAFVLLLAGVAIASFAWIVWHTDPTHGIRPLPPDELAPSSSAIAPAPEPAPTLDGPRNIAVDAGHAPEKPAPLKPRLGPAK